MRRRGGDEVKPSNETIERNLCCGHGSITLISQQNMRTIKRLRLSHDDVLILFLPVMKVCLVASFFFFGHSGLRVLQLQQKRIGFFSPSTFRAPWPVGWGRGQGRRASRQRGPKNNTTFGW